ncbi:MAG: 50S ribosomal protein L17 [Candidatus Taylorbacteria bacterium RIFCSPLOWO2_01_FULL_45_15b]|uniref:Large ribosomal subunit protein bL17 n=1 Tax=Candidatus Taylorbacteria bacterium RIFCSPLOWO2_01_FULL_45_15b TaxID=1802319 RepID=A0A1G2NCF2_9BACT|nr:MAG: 50S ribosomal protein L17 [Candidatus Taylorbacteria bacterium RIFCSPLOWO2_01_FULL_45_15b]
MLHHKKNRKFGLERGQRIALLKSLARSLILKERISTTEAKAKELRPFVEKLITIGKRDTVSARRILMQRLSSEPIANKIQKKISPKFKDRNGGYTRIFKVAPRKSDASPMAIIEFVV